jgi:hypothetical protein
MHPKNGLLLFQPVVETKSERCFKCGQNSNERAMEKKIISSSLIGKRGI